MAGFLMKLLMKSRDGNGVEPENNGGDFHALGRST